jgi:hypothetical protein
MGSLSSYRHLPIDWDMTPEEAVTMYLEWGNNCWKGERSPVRSKDDESYYFVVNTWDSKPRVILIRRNSECAEELADLELPRQLEEPFSSASGYLKGVHAITPEIRQWLENQMDTSPSG